MSKTEIFMAIFIAVISSSALNGIVTHLLYNNKLKKELKYKGNDLIAKEIENSLQSFREIELKLKVHEIYNAENRIKNKEVDFFNGECFYPEILNNWESLYNFMNSIRDCRLHHEKNLSCKIALNLVFIDRYLSQLCLFLKGFEEDVLPLWGTIVITDLSEWQAKIDKLIVKEINKYTYKLESHETKKWKKIRKKEIEKQYSKTILNSIITGKINPKHRNRTSIIKKLLKH